MEHALHAAFDGTIADVKISIGQQVSQGDVLIVVEAADES